MTLSDSKGGANKAITIKKSIGGVVITPQSSNLKLQQNANSKEDDNKKTIDIPKGTPITSPMVGTFYESPSPKLPPFVKEGDMISKGQVICILEAMKLMNEIESDIAGKVTKICVKNGEAVEFGQVLMYIE